MKGTPVKKRRDYVSVFRNLKVYSSFSPFCVDVALSVEDQIRLIFF